MKEKRTIYSRSDTYVKIPKNQCKFDDITAPWKDGLVTGNGHIGVVASCDPYEEVMVLQNTEFVMPTHHPRVIPPEVGGQLEAARQAVLEMDEDWDVFGRERTNLYPHHPGMQIRVTIEGGDSGESEYLRWVDMADNSINVQFRDERGLHERKTVALRKEDCLLSHFTGDEGYKLSIDDAKSLVKYGKQKHGSGTEKEAVFKYECDDEFLVQIGEYPHIEGSELNGAGYVCICRHWEEDGLWLASKCMVASMSDMEQMIVMLKAELRDLENVAVELMEGAAGETEDLKTKLEIEAARGAETCSNEELIALQQNCKQLVPELIERLYANGRYALECSSGYSIPRLCGIWSGDWNPEWHGAYTMDANVNIQMSGICSAGIRAAERGYINFVSRQFDDWRANAQAVYGISDAFLVPVNTDGLRAIVVEYDKDYPFEYWNAGASWMLRPVFECWQTYGDEEAARTFQEMLLPTLRLWSGLCDARYFVDAAGRMRHEEGHMLLEAGEKYLIIPGFSPENRPLNYNNPTTANTTMDIAAMRDVIYMAREYLELAEDYPEEWAVQVQQIICRLEAGIPEYMLDVTGGLKEWSLKCYEENHAHRHVSHLYPVWPGDEAKLDNGLAAASRIALCNRDKGNDGKDDTCSHGWIHRALIAARLGDGEECVRILKVLLRSDILYKSLFTDHNTDRWRGVYCTDTAIGLVGVIGEMLCYSRRGYIELLPAWPDELGAGRVEGLRCRTQAVIEEMSWDSLSVHVKIRSLVKQNIVVKCGGSAAGDDTSSEAISGEIPMDFEENEVISLDLGR